MVVSQSMPFRDDTAAIPPSSAMRFVLAAGSLMSLFAVASVWAGEFLVG